MHTRRGLGSDSSSLSLSLWLTLSSLFTRFTVRFPARRESTQRCRASLPSLSLSPVHPCLILPHLPSDRSSPPHTVPHSLTLSLLCIQAVSAAVGWAALSLLVSLSSLHFACLQVPAALLQEKTINLRVRCRKASLFDIFDQSAKEKRRGTASEGRMRKRWHGVEVDGHASLVLLHAKVPSSSSSPSDAPDSSRRERDVSANAGDELFRGKDCS